MYNIFLTLKFLKLKLYLNSIYPLKCYFFLLKKLLCVLHLQEALELGKRYNLST